MLPLPHATRSSARSPSISISSTCSCICCNCWRRRSEGIEILSGTERSDRLDRIGGHPDVDLLKSRLQPVLKLLEEYEVFREVRDVDKHSGEFVLVRLTLMLPKAADGLSFRRYGSESLLQFQQRVSD